MAKVHQAIPHNGGLEGNWPPAQEATARVKRLAPGKHRVSRICEPCKVLVHCVLFDRHFRNQPLQWSLP